MRKHAVRCRAWRAAMAGLGLMGAATIAAQEAEIASVARHESQPVVMQATARTTDTCPQQAADCITTPYRSGDGVPGGTGVGLLIKGSHGYGGISQEWSDYHDAAEAYIQRGSFYVVSLPGWLGGDICITRGITHRYYACMTRKGLTLDGQTLTGSDIAKLHKAGL
jgi:hypothetical protein